MSMISRFFLMGIRIVHFVHFPSYLSLKERCFHVSFMTVYCSVAVSVPSVAVCHGSVIVSRVQCEEELPNNSTIPNHHHHHLSFLLSPV